MTPYERAQSVSFVTRYDHLTERVSVQLVHEEGRWTIANLWVLRHVLNDFRPIIQNQTDSVYYGRLHSVWGQMLHRKDPAEGLTIRVHSEDGADVTDLYSAYLRENRKALATVLSGLEFSYLYNGILQHSDAEWSKRFWEDYASGNLNYVLWKHVRILGLVREFLHPYYTLIRQLTFPSLGSL